MDQATRDFIRQSLAKFWDDRSVELDDAATVEGLIDELDSLSAVDALLPIEEQLGMEIEADQVIRRGGYNDKQQFVDHLSARIERYVAAAAVV